MISLFGRLIPFFNTGKVLRMEELYRASRAAKMHQEDTNRNCTTVSVTGLGKAVRMALDEVLERIEVANQTPQSICGPDQHYPLRHILDPRVYIQLAFPTLVP